MSKIKLLILLLVINLGLAFSITVNATPSSQRQMTIDLVNKSIQHLKQHGKYKAILAFNRYGSKFITKRHFVFSFICGSKNNDGFLLVPNPGDEKSGFTDLSQRYAAITQIAHSIPKTGKWYHYPAMNPADNKIEPKYSFIRFLPQYKLCIGSGYYDNSPSNTKTNS